MPRTSRDLTESNVNFVIAMMEADGAIDTLGRTLWGEVRGKPRLGKEAVAAVVPNRLRRNAPERFGATVEDVCRKPQQFSCWNLNGPDRV